jgi:hypothetical protein
MTRDDIIRIAEESGVLWTTPHGVLIWCPDELERFVALVAAAEREACAKACESLLDEGEDSYVVNRCLVVIRVRGAA